ncbi:MAG: hypothetical protein WBA64_08870 [Marinomonas sp.]|uniref:hypothetical protein n=1 Tax=Marinomonas sp. TaxID=1904862 RepID=UPI003C747E30
MEQVIRVLTTIRPKRSLFLSVMVTLATIGFFWYLSATHAPAESWGAKALFPTLFVLTIALISRAPFESLLAGVIAGLTIPVSFHHCQIFCRPSWATKPLFGLFWFVA